MYVKIHFLDPIYILIGEQSEPTVGGWMENLLPRMSVCVINIYVGI